LRYIERHEEERDGGRERDKVRKIIMKIEIRPAALSPSSDFLLRERDNLVHIIHKRHYIVSYIYRYMFINSEREIIMKIDLQCS
jgi:hypothetical protein